MTGYTAQRCQSLNLLVGATVCPDRALQKRATGTIFLLAEEVREMNEVGKHIKGHLFGVSFEKLNDVVVAERFLLEAVEAAEMRALDQPWVYDIKLELEMQGETPYPDEPEGVTGVVVLSTSHVAIHTYPRRGYAVFDLYSCRDFDSRAPFDVAQRVYGQERDRCCDLSDSLELPPMLMKREE